MRAEWEGPPCGSSTLCFLPYFTGPDGAPISHLPEMVRAPLLGGRWVGFCIKFGKTLRVMFTGSGWVIKKPVLVT